LRCIGDSAPEQLVDLARLVGRQKSQHATFRGVF